MFFTYRKSELIEFCDRVLRGLGGLQRVMVLEIKLLGHYVLITYPSFVSTIPT